MAEMSREEFKRAYRKERDPRVVKRMAAVNMAHYIYVNPPVSRSDFHSIR